ncbi:MAG: hypothetical protein WCO55_00425 [Candidatus Falkowbacteria bacterium]
MKIIGPEYFKLKINNSKSFDLLPQMDIVYSTKKGVPKLYIVSHNKKPIYVGITTQPIRSRINYGFSAVGRGGYHGYKWRNNYKEVDLNIWIHQDGDNKEDVEIIEAEVVYEIRNQFEQWPSQQTEIHFHQSNKKHRDIAKKILSTGYVR